ncbi:hypothetical protein VCHA43P273_10572 [Vibrio chagasii]|nr:hypothetical protein VCHA37O173_10416 [Vibrio chagasii]CAH6893180.1 hypothetical protein VCHA29O39_20416 [Vibrio chagasii]CAH6896687.1 hypothetical protein VCHA30O60_30117 [Vibrio chagasii]CAH6900446.1 hypothetical protein VCHA36P161_20415 [Vibrio chagasii]CAH7086185.1 hypothetical protein VCHA43P273_10572 [Vibrio chagasii]
MLNKYPSALFCVTASFGYNLIHLALGLSPLHNNQLRLK